MTVALAQTQLTLEGFDQPGGVEGAGEEAAGGVWLTQFSGDGSHVEQRLLRSGMVTATPGSSFFWTGDRYIVQ